MQACPSCGSDVPAGARFCPACGAALTDTRAPDDMLKLVTVLFADVVGSTARAEASHPEDVRAVMTSYFDAMAGEIRAEGGTLEKFVGDAIMAVFGVPAAHEDDPVRAVRAARRMLDRLRGWNASRVPGEQLEIRIGLETGDVVASGAAARELLVTGDSVNVAARLQQVAEPGTIVVGERTARAVRSHFALREVEEPLGLKGKSEPVGAWIVLGERETVEERGVPGLTAPLVGRDRELDFLRTELDRVSADGRPALVTLLGDAGIGKSRLVRELLGDVDDDVTVLLGRCLPSGQGTTLLPLADMLEARAGVFDSDGAETALEKVAQLVDSEVDADVTTERTAAALASTLNVEHEAMRTLDPRERQRELVSAWRALLASLARRAPVVAVIEDLHWADPQMLDILDELADRLEGQILFVCTSRPDLLRERPDWGGGRRNFSSLPLDALSAEESSRLVSLLLEVDSLPEVTRRGILARSEGNPFFLEEIIRHLIDEGLLVHDGGRWSAREEIRAVDLPDSVQAVILARLDLLSPDEKRVAQRAAVIGRFFWDGAVEAVAGSNGELDVVLGTLRRREFVLERISSSIAGQREFVFKHVLIRDVAYESLPRRERGRAHVEAAVWLERTSGTRATDLSEQLAHHYHAAFVYLGTDELRCKARARLLDAAANAHRRFATEHGERLARQAVDLSSPGAERVEALEALADAHYHVGDAAWRAYSEGLAELSESDPNFSRLAGKAAQFGSRWVGTMAELPSIAEVRRLIVAGLRAAPAQSRERAQLLVDEGFLILQRENQVDEVADRAVDEAVAAAEAAGTRTFAPPRSTSPPRERCIAGGTARCAASSRHARSSCRSCETSRRSATRTRWQRGALTTSVCTATPRRARRPASSGRARSTRALTSTGSRGGWRRASCSATGSVHSRIRRSSSASPGSTPASSPPASRSARTRTSPSVTSCAATTQPRGGTSICRSRPWSVRGPTPRGLSARCSFLRLRARSPIVAASTRPSPSFRSSTGAAAPG